MGTPLVLLSRPVGNEGAGISAAIFFNVLLVLTLALIAPGNGRKNRQKPTTRAGAQPGRLLASNLDQFFTFWLFAQQRISRRA